MPGAGHRSSGLRAAELAWLLLSLLDAGIRLRGLGWCLGLLSARDVRVTSSGVERAAVPDGLRHRHLERRRHRHMREGHEISCHLIGIPASSAQALLGAWGDPRAIPFARGVLDEVVSELRASGVGPHRGWSEPRAWEIAEHTVMRRITPVPPVRALFATRERAALPTIGERGPLLEPGGADQMPSDPSKLPASSRSFTWERKRAASAPSTMRWS